MASSRQLFWLVDLTLDVYVSIWSLGVTNTVFPADNLRSTKKWPVESRFLVDWLNLRPLYITFPIRVKHAHSRTYTFEIVSDNFLWRRHCALPSLLSVFYIWIFDPSFHLIQFVSAFHHLATIIFCVCVGAGKRNLLISPPLSEPMTPSSSLSPCCHGTAV